MKLHTWLRWVVPATALLVIAGCIRLTGQRITIRHDAAGDRLYVLIHYDGIHNDKKAEQEDAEGKLRAFQRHGDVMLFDWFGHVQREEILREAASEGTGPRTRAFAEKLAASMETTSLGHYRDANGRVGVAQLVVFDRVSEVVAAANASISEVVLALPDETRDGAWDRTLRRWKDLARREHAWVAIDGHALVFRCAVDPFEWARGKLEFLADLSKEWKEDAEAGEVQENLAHRVLASAPLSLVQSGAEVEARFGDPGAPSTLRCEWRHGYRDNVEHVVTEIVPDDLDRLLAPCLLGERRAEGGLAELLAWGPPEDRVRAVLGVAKGADDGRRARATRWLQDFAGDWNGRGLAPAAPVLGDDPETLLARWEQWYRRLLAQPRL